MLPITAFASSTQPPQQAAEWAERLHNLIPNSIEGIRTVQDLGTLPPDSIYTILNSNWPTLTTEGKLYVLSCIVQNDNPRMLDILDLGVHDPAIMVQNRALQYCESFGFEAFTEDYDAYLKWRESSQNKPLKEVLAASLKSVVAAIPRADEAQRGVLFNILVRANFNATSQTSRWRRDAAISCRLADALLPWMKEQNNMMWTCFQIIRGLRPGEEFMRTKILPLADAKTETSVRYQALSTLGSPDNLLAIDPLLKMMRAEYPDAPCEMIGQAISQVGDPKVIPALIMMMETDNSPEGNRVIGNVLAPLTGVNNSVVRDSRWWRSWWTRNSKRFSPEVRSTPFNKVTVRPRPLPADPLSPVLRAAQPMLKQVAGDVKRSYWFVDPRPQFRPGSGAARPPVNVGASVAQQAPPGLIVVLPGDGDGATASAFWQEAARKALEGRYCIAIVNAPKWSDTQAITWVTTVEMKRVKEAKFAAEALIQDVVKDVQAYRTIDSSRVILHGIGAGGVPAYCASLDASSTFTATFIASAPFRTAELPSLDSAKGKRYLIQNAKDDRAHPFWMAEAAQKLLQQKGAIVQMDATAGYLGSLSDESYAPLLRASIESLSKK
jgi:predicted esterase